MYILVDIKLAENIPDKFIVINKTNILYYVNFLHAPTIFSYYS